MTTNEAQKTEIQTNGLVKNYGDVIAVDGVSLNIPKNTIYALLGPNGAGKTTTISMLTTLTKPSEGTAHVAGFDVAQQPDEVRRRIGVTFQETVLDEALSGRHVLDYHGRLYGQSRAERRRKITELLAMVELEEAADRVVRTYSGGMKRRLELARGLMTEPEVLFLDEPTLGLDPQNRTKIWDYIRNLKERKGLTLVMTTHYMDEAEQLADNVGIIDRGRIVAEGTPRELIDQMGADTITITSQEAGQDFASTIEALPFVQTVTTNERITQIGVDSGNQRLPEIIENVLSSGCTIEEVSIAKPSLSDVFLKYTGRQLRDK